MLLIGSRATQYVCLKARHANDWDFIVTPKELATWIKDRVANIVKHRLREDEKKVFVHLKTGEHIEFELAHPGSSGEMFLNCGAVSGLVVRNSNLGSFYVASPTALYLIKKSHVKHPIRWFKTIEDYHFLKGWTRSLLSDSEVKAFEKRSEEVNNRASRKKKVNLNMSNEDFFKKSSGKVRRIYEHDDLHLVTSYYEIPLYQQLKHDKTKAKLEKDLWDKLDYKDQLKVVREECYAIALERTLIPMLEPNGCLNEYKEDKDFLDHSLTKDCEVAAFEDALMRICTTLTKGWFQNFAIENYPVIKDYDREFLGVFLTAVKNGSIRRIEDERHG